MCDLDDTLMKGKDNVVELAATHLHQSAIAENENGKQPVAAVAEECDNRKAKKRRRNRIFSRRLRSMRDIIAARHVTLSPILRVRASLRSTFIFFAN